MTHGRRHMKLVLAVNLTIVLVAKRPYIGLEVGIVVNSHRHPVTVFGRELCDLGLTSSVSGMSTRVRSGLKVGSSSVRYRRP